jgi:hypothetical protein
LLCGGSFTGIRYIWEGIQACDETWVFPINFGFNYIVADGDTTVKSEEADSYGWLEEIEIPENSQMDGIEYLGPPVIEPTC